MTEKPFYGLAFSGDGSFTMNPQILIDGVEHGARGCILLLDNRRMAAISGLQYAQYNKEHATSDIDESAMLDSPPPPCTATFCWSRHSVRVELLSRSVARLPPKLPAEFRVK